MKTLKITDADVGFASPEAPVGVLEKVFDILKDSKKGKILDVPSGKGVFSKKLYELGFDVYSADIEPEKFNVSGVQCEKVNLNESLPYASDYFDYVVCMEGIEHVENQHFTIREFKRILKTDGKLIITTPNILNVFSRLRYFLIGFTDYAGGFYRYAHINLATYPQFFDIFQKEELKVENIYTNRNVLSSRSVFLKPLLYLLAFLIKAVTRIKSSKDFMPEELLSEELLYGEDLMMMLKK